MGLEVFISGKTARRLRKELEGCSANHNALQTKAVGAAAAAALAIAIAPGVAQATEVPTGGYPEQAATETVAPVAKEGSSEIQAARPTASEEPMATIASAPAPDSTAAPVSMPETSVSPDVSAPTPADGDTAAADPAQTST